MRLFVLVLLSAAALSAQTSPAPQPQRALPVLAAHPDWPKAAPGDVDTIEHTVHAFFSAISAPAGGTLDRDRVRSLFVPEGRIVVGLPATSKRPADVIFRTPDEYVTGFNTRPGMDGFFDRNPANQVERFGVMAHVYAFYESRSHEADAQPMARGMKSFELVNSAGRWYIVQVYWDSERPDNPIPERYLHNSER